MRSLSVTGLVGLFRFRLLLGVGVFGFCGGSDFSVDNPGRLTAKAIGPRFSGCPSGSGCCTLMSIDAIMFSSFK